MKKILSLNERNEIRNAFYRRANIPDELKVKKGDSRAGYIYKIVNKNNNKVYIGKTSNISIRSSNYVRKYLEGNPDRKIDIAIYNEGIENFYMTPIAEFSNQDEGVKLELEMISKYNSIENGYNIAYSSQVYNCTGNPHGVLHTYYMKMSKSKYICAINNNTNEMIFATGMKLFGDYIGKTKDLVKNRAKNQTKINGYFIIYLDDNDRESQLLSITAKYSKYKHMKHTLINRLTEFNDACSYVSNILHNDVIIFDGRYKITCIVQDDKSESGITKISLYDFMEIVSQ